MISPPCVSSIGETIEVIGFFWFALTPASTIQRLLFGHSTVGGTLVTLQVRSGQVRWSDVMRCDVMRCDVLSCALFCCDLL